MKARVTLKEGFRYYKTDGLSTDVKDGDVIDASEMTGSDYSARISAGHLVAVDDKTAISITAPNALDPTNPAGNAGLLTRAQKDARAKDLKAADDKEAAEEDKKLADLQKKAAADDQKAANKK